MFWALRHVGLCVFLFSLSLLSFLLLLFLVVMSIVHIVPRRHKILYLLLSYNTFLFPIKTLQSHIILLPDSHKMQVRLYKNVHKPKTINLLLLFLEDVRKREMTSCIPTLFHQKNKYFLGSWFFLYFAFL